MWSLEIVHILEVDDVLFYGKANQEHVIRPLYIS